MTFKIEKNVPMPVGIGKSGILHKYPWDKMEIGDSFFAPSHEGKKSRAISAAHWANRIMAPKKFATRTVEGGVRVWRIA